MFLRVTWLAWISYFYFAHLSVGFLMIRKLRLPGLINRDDIESLLAFLDD